MAERKKYTASDWFGAIAVCSLLFYGVWYFSEGGGLEQDVAKTLSKIEVEVAIDSLKQYEIAKRSGSAIDRCVHAGMVAAAFIQAKDEASYKRWKSTEEIDCAAVVPK